MDGGRIASTESNPTFSSYMFLGIYQKAVLTKPKDTYVENELIRFYSRDRENQPIWIPKEAKIAEQLLHIAYRCSKHRGKDMTLASLAPDKQSAYFI